MGGKPENPAPDASPEALTSEERQSKVGDLGRGSHEQTQGVGGDHGKAPHAPPPPPD